MVFAKYGANRKQLMNIEEINEAILDGAIIIDDDGNLLTKHNGELVDNIDDFLPYRVIYYWKNESEGI